MTRLKHLFTILILVTLGALSYYATLQSGYTLSSLLERIGLQQNEATESLPTPTGVIVITGVKTVGEEVETKFVQNYALDLSADTPIWERIGSVSQGTISSAFIEPVSVERPQSAFARSLIIGKDRELKGVVLRADMPDRNVTILAIDPLENPRHLAWSEARQLLAYESADLDATPEERAMAETITIKVHNPKTETMAFEIKEAMQPFWTPDGTYLVYLQKDGIHAREMDTNIDTLLIGVEGYDPEKRHLDANTKIGMSPDGRYLAWTAPSSGTLHIFEVTSWSPFVWKTIQREVVPGTQFYWPIFSPDSKHIVVQAIDGDPLGGERTNARMEIRSIGSNDVVRSYPLGDFDFNKLFTDTWVATSIDSFNFSKYFEESWSVRLPKLFQLPTREDRGDEGGE